MKATVAILTLNAQDFLDEVLEACLSQDTPFDYEVLVIDSGSTDRTLEIVARHPNVRLHQIPNRDFGHGRTRNLAASLAGGDIVAFLTHDATPSSRQWLTELLAPFESDDRVAAVYGKQIPRPRCAPTLKRDVAEAFAPGGIAGTAEFFSNVNSAVSKRALERIPFRDVGYAEDKALAADLRSAGYLITYAERAAVLHSHDLRLRAYFRRMYDEARGVMAVGTRPRTSLWWLAGATVRGILRDWAFIWRDRDYGLAEKAGWSIRVMAYNAARRLAIRLAVSERLPEWVDRRLSLERQSRRRAAGTGRGGA